MTERSRVTKRRFWSRSGEDQVAIFRWMEKSERTTSGSCVRKVDALSWSLRQLDERLAVERGVAIRSISRSIAVLRVINRRRSSSLMQIARLSGLPYPTACRIVQTLMQDGLIECEPTRKFYRATEHVHALSRGFRNEDALVTIGRPFIVALTKKSGWPVTVTTRVGLSMMVRDSTDDLTALTTELHPPGYSTPLVDCAAGRVVLAWVDDDERRRVAAAMEEGGDAGAALRWFDDGEVVARIREDGHACCDDRPDDPDAVPTFSIAVPLREGGRPVGALALTFIASMIGRSDALERHLGDLKDAAASIEHALGSVH